MTKNAETRESQSEEFQKPEPEPTKKDQLRNTTQKGNVSSKKCLTFDTAKQKLLKAANFNF